MPQSPEFLEACMHELIAEIWQVRQDGQQEYARSTNAFANFESLGRELGLTREQILWVYGRKHIDGIASWIRGYKSQRENVRGRIKDLIMYMLILAAMEVDSQDRPAPDPTMEAAEDFALWEHVEKAIDEYYRGKSPT